LYNPVFFFFFFFLALLGASINRIGKDSRVLVSIFFLLQGVGGNSICVGSFSRFICLIVTVCSEDLLTPLDRLYS